MCVIERPPGRPTYDGSCDERSSSGKSAADADIDAASGTAGPKSKSKSIAEDKSGNIESNVSPSPVGLADTSTAAPSGTRSDVSSTTTASMLFESCADVASTLRDPGARAGRLEPGCRETCRRRRAAIASDNSSLGIGRGRRPRPRYSN
jgi:hypothetical protein